MATDQYVLAYPPEEPRLRELWLQHAAGFILMQNVRQAAIDQLAPQLSGEERAVAIGAVDATMYQLMAVIDGVSRGLTNPMCRFSRDNRSSELQRWVAEVNVQ